MHLLHELLPLFVELWREDRCWRHPGRVHVSSSRTVPGALVFAGCLAGRCCRLLDTTSSSSSHSRRHSTGVSRLGWGGLTGCGHDGLLQLPAVGGKGVGEVLQLLLRARHAAQDGCRRDCCHGSSSGVCCWVVCRDSHSALATPG